MDLLGNVAIGGSCFDQSLCPAAIKAPLPTIEYVNKEGLQMWVKQIYDSSQYYDFVAAVKFKPNNQRIALILDRKNPSNPNYLTIIIISVFEPSIIIAFYDKQLSNPYLVNQNSLMYDSLNNIYIGLQHFQHAVLIKFTDSISAQTSQLLLKSMQSNQDCGSFDALFIDEPDLYFTGKVLKNQICTSILAKILTTDGSQKWTMTFKDVDLIATMSSLVVKSNSNGGQVAYSCGMGSKTYGDQMAIIARQSHDFSSENKIYASSNSPVSQACLAVHPQDQNVDLAFAFISKATQTRNKISLIRINFGNDMIDTFNFQDIFNVAGNQFFYAKFIDSASFYLIGTLHSYNNLGATSPTYQNKMGFITKYSTNEGLYDANCDFNVEIAYTQTLDFQILNTQSEKIEGFNFLFQNFEIPLRMLETSFYLYNLNTSYLIRNECHKGQTLVSAIIPTMDSFTYDTGTEFGVKFYYHPAFISSDPNCETIFSYFISSTPYTPNIQYYNYQRYVTWYSQSIIPNQYKVYILAQSANGIFTESFFNLEIVNSCQNALIATSIPIDTSYNYIISQDQLSIQLQPFSSVNPSNCIISYTVGRDSGSPAYNAQIISWDYSKFQINVYNLDNSGLQNSYKVKVTGQIAGYRASISSVITINVKHQCYSQVITPTIDLLDIVYDIQLPQAQVSFVLIQWTQILPIICPDITYDLLLPGGAPVSTSILQYNQQGGLLDFIIVAKDQIDVGIHTIMIRASIFNVTTHEEYATFNASFKLTITNRCLLESVVNPFVIIENDTYFVGNPIKSFHFEGLTNTLPCPNNFLYTVAFSPNPIDSGGKHIMTFDAINQMISIQTSDISMATAIPIHVTIVGELPNKQFNSFAFDIFIINQCEVALYQPQSEIPVDFDLNLNGQKVTQQIPTFMSNASLSICGILTQKMKVVDNNGATFNSSQFLVWNSSNNTLILQNQNGALQALSPFTLSFTTQHSVNGTNSFIMSFKVFISGVCIVQNLAVDSTVFDETNTMIIQDYTIHSGPKIISVSRFTDQFNCGIPIVYSLNLQSGEKTPNFIKNDFTGPKLMITFNSNTRADYKLQQILVLSGQIKNPDSTVYVKEVYIPLNIILINLGPPYFISELKKGIVQIGKVLEVKLPSIADPDKEDKSEVKSISYGGAESFATFTKPIIRFTPTLTNGAADMTYQISITLKDDNPHSQSGTYTFDLVVTAPPQAEIKDSVKNVGSTKAQQNQSSQQGEASSTFNSQQTKKTSTTSKSIKPPTVNSKAFHALIDTVAQDGLVTIFFSKNIEIPTGHIFNNSTMKIQVRSTVPDEEDVLEIRPITKWIMTSISKEEMKIQIEFEDSIKVSPTSDYDRLTIKFLKDNMIFSADQENILDYREALFAGVPPQLPTGKLAVLLGKSTKAASSAVTGAITTNIVLAFFLGVSMKKLWMMVSALQIIVHFPMLKIPLPANLIMILTAVVDIVNLGILPKVYIKQFLSYIFNDTSVSLVFLVIMLFAFVALLIILTRILLKRYKLAQKIQKKISKRLFFNPFFRSHLKGYIKFCLAAMISLSNFEDQNIVNKIFTISFMGYLLLIPGLFFLILYKSPMEKLDSPEFENRCGTLYTNIRTDSKSALCFNIIYMLRRLFLAFTITFLSGSALLQGFVLIISSLVMITYMITVKPFDSKNMLYFEVANEVTILCVSYLIFVNADLLNDEQTRLNVGWYITGIIALNIFANFVNVVIQMIEKVFVKIKALYIFIFKKNAIQKKEALKSAIDQSLYFEEYNQVSPKSAATIKGATAYIQHSKSYFNHFSFQPKGDFEKQAGQMVGIQAQINKESKVKTKPSLMNNFQKLFFNKRHSIVKDQRANISTTNANKIQRKKLENILENEQERTKEQRQKEQLKYENYSENEEKTNNH